MIVSPANEAINGGQPSFAIGGVPPSPTAGCPPSRSLRCTTASTPRTAPSYVVADTGQPEIDYSLPSGITAESHYQGDGGVQLSSFMRRLAFSIRFSDFNLLISSYVTLASSRLMFDTDVQQAASRWHRS